MFRKIFFERIFVSESHTVPVGSIPVPLVAPNPIAIEIPASENHENRDFFEKRLFLNTFVSFALENESNLILGLNWHEIADQDNLVIDTAVDGADITCRGISIITTRTY